MRAVLILAMLAATALPLTAGAAQPNADKAAARRISSHLQQSGQLKNYRIGVTYKDGIASLNGTVASNQQLETAIRLAEQVTGVTKVESKLTCPEQSDVAGTRGGGDSNNAITELPAKQSSEFGQIGGPTEGGIVQANANQQINAKQQIAAAHQRQLQQQRPMQMQRRPMNRQRAMPRNNMPLPHGRMQDPSVRQTSAQGVYQAGGHACQGPGGPMGGGAMMGGGGGMMGGGQAMPAGFVPHGGARGPSYENPQMPGYAWPSYASYPNYAAVSYPQQYSPTAWPYIGPFYPYPQVPLAWRKVSLEWDDGWWFLDFSAHNSSH
jgi:BON domain